MTVLYKDFLVKRNIYHLQMGYWKRIIFHKLNDQGEKYTEYLNTRFNNGELFYDGNPIFNLKECNGNKAVRIVQEDYNEFGDLFEKIVNENNDLSEMVIVLTLTDKTSKMAVETISQWFKS